MHFTCFASHFMFFVLNKITFSVFCKPICRPNHQFVSKVDHQRKSILLSLLEYCKNHQLLDAGCSGATLIEINSLAPGRCGCNFTSVFSKFMSQIHIFSTSCETGFRWMPLNHTDDESTLVQLMAWCSQATNHYLNQCWPRSLLPYGVIGLQSVNKDFSFMCWLFLKKNIFTVSFFSIFLHSYGSWNSS